MSDISIKNRCGAGNQVADHLSRIENSVDPDEFLYSVLIFSGSSWWRLKPQKLMPKEIISDEGSYFCNQVVAALFSKYGLKH